MLGISGANVNNIGGLVLATTASQENPFIAIKPAAWP